MADAKENAKTNRWLMVVLAMLAVSVLTTGGFTLYLALGGTMPGTTAGEAAGDGGQGEESGPAVQNTAPITREERIAFVSDQEGGAAVYTMLPDGSDVKRICPLDLAFCFSPSWSPDGGRLAYAGATESPFTEDDVAIGVWVSTADGKTHVRVSDDVANVGTGSPAWSPDGTQLAFAAYEETTAEQAAHGVIYVAMADGSGVEHSFVLPGGIHQVTWSPGGDRLLAVSGDLEVGTVVQVMPVDGSEVTEIYHHALVADWSPNGQAVVVGDYESQDVVVIDLNEDGQETAVRPVGQTIMQALDLTWSPDGAWVAAGDGHYRQGYATGLHLIAVESGDLRTIADGQGWLGWPDWSRNGQQLVFTWGYLERPRGLPRASLWIYHIPSGELQQITGEDCFWGAGTWSP